MMINFEYVHPFVAGDEAEKMLDRAGDCLKMLHDGKVRGGEFLGWLNLPSRKDEELFERIRETASFLKEKTEVVVVTGVGGSYLGARAVIESLSHSFKEVIQNERHPLVVFAGHNLSEDNLSELVEVLNDKSYAIIVISKSGTTTEPAVAFRILRNHLKMKYGSSEAAERIVAITDPSKGALCEMARRENYRLFPVPPDVGGRFSVLTAVGLLPVAVAGVDIDRLMGGAAKMEELTGRGVSLKENPSVMYAAYRNMLYLSGKKIEVLAASHPKLAFFAEWWKQLFGESEGKENKGIFPASVNYTADLHSMGQYIQEGERHLFETIISVEAPQRRLSIPAEKEDADNLNYLAGKRISHINRMAVAGTALAHSDGEVPVIEVKIPFLDEHYLGRLIYFFEKACAISGCMLGVNPFNQPGVEAYKKNMFALLGKPGFEEDAKRIRERLKM